MAPTTDNVSQPAEKQSEKKGITFWLEPRSYARIKRIAELNERPIAWVFRKIVEHFDYSLIEPAIENVGKNEKEENNNGYG